MDDNRQAGFVFNIQHYSLHDGSGIRTNVFLKGCPLRCSWCCNPESQRLQPEVAFDEGKCILCGSCGVGREKPPVFATESGIVCNRAALEAEPERLSRLCPTGAIFMYGEEKNVGVVMDEVERDAAFYAHGDGGITLSGGEPLFQPTFALALLREAKRRHINAAIETCGYTEPETLLIAAELLDHVFYDIKTLDSARHKAYTGVGNERILDNFRLLCERFPSLPKLVRSPVIPGFNEHEVDQINAFALSFPNVKFQALPYHTYGVKKYAMLGRTYDMTV